MNEYLSWILSEYRQRGLLVDTNILVLLVVGTRDRSRIGRTRRTESYVVEDYDLAIAFVHHFDRIVTHPSILSETSNLVSQTLRSEAVLLNAILADFIDDAMERSVSAVDIARHRAFSRFGFTDTAIVHIAESDVPVLTDDLPLYNLLVHSGVPALNFNHLREGNLLS